VTFTVVVPARNRQALIVRAVSSALAQSRPPDAVVVVDDGSTDDTASVAEAAGARVVRLATSGGSGPARNAGAAAADSDWIAYLDSDDEWRPDHLEVLEGFLDGRVLVSSAASSTSGGVRGLVSPTPVPVTSASVFGALNPLVTSGTTVRRSALAAAGGFRPLPRAQDFDCWIRVLEQGAGIATGRETVFYHEHGDQVSRNGDLNRASVLKIIDDAAARPWCTPRLRSDTLARYLLDDVRTGQRLHEPDRVRRTLRTAAARPGVWPALVRLTAVRATGKLRRPAGPAGPPS